MLDQAVQQLDGEISQARAESRLRTEELHQLESARDRMEQRSESLQKDVQRMQEEEQSRAARLDELPQLINILKGDMSIVGPRPERKCLAEEISKEIPEFCYRLKVRGGLTGYAQIYGKYNTTAYDKLKLDLMYIESYSILEDLKLILATFKIVFTKESTEGLEEGQTISLNAKEEEKKDV